MEIELCPIHGQTSRSSRCWRRTPSRICAPGVAWQRFKQLQESQQAGKARMGSGEAKARQRSKTERHLLYWSWRCRISRDHRKCKKEVRGSYGSCYALQDGDKKACSASGSWGNTTSRTGVGRDIMNRTWTESHRYWRYNHQFLGGLCLSSNKSELMSLIWRCLKARGKHWAPSFRTPRSPDGVRAKWWRTHLDSLFLHWHLDE